MVTNSSALTRNIIALFLGATGITLLLISLLVFKLTAGVALIAFVLGVGYIGLISLHQRFGYYFFLILCMAYPSIQLYFGVGQFGVILDSILLITVLTFLYAHYSTSNSELDFYRYKSFWIWVVWILLSLTIQALNWENVNWLSFTYGIRRQHLNPLGLILLNILFIKTKRDFKLALLSHLSGAVFLALISERQFLFGFNSFEFSLLQTPFGRTHLLPGITRYWGGFTDAASSGIGLSLMILAAIPFVINKSQLRGRTWIYLMIALFVHAGLLSGTRSAYASFAAGTLIITLMYVRPKIQWTIIGISSIVFGVLRFTSLGSSYTVIRRLRSVFDRQDASLLVRISNRLKLDDWLQSHPLGGGIGAASFDKRFAVDSFLSTFPPDGLFVLIKAELGFLGIAFFYIICALIIVYMFVAILKTPNYTDAKLWMSTCLALFIAARVSDYAQMISFQFPLVNLLFLSIVAFEKFQYWPQKVVFFQKREAPLR